MKAAIRVIGIFFCALLVLELVIGQVGSQPATASRTLPDPVVNQPEEGVVSRNSMVAPQSTRAPHMWTEAEMAAAKPYPVTERQGQADMLVPLTASADTPSPVAQLKTFPAGLPEGEVGTLNDLSGLTSLGTGSPTAPSGYGYPAPFTRYTYYGRYSKEYPYKTIGKLYFVQYGTAYVCSASSVGNYGIWTAGHCVHAGDNSSSGWSYYVMFLPAYDAGKKPMGQWFDVNLWTTGGWYSSGDLRYDMGGVILGVQKRKKISQKVGWLGFAYQSGGTGYAPFHWFGIGYPQASPFDGLKQVVCASSYAYSDTSFGTPYPVGVGCDQTGGTSGGPWILSFGSGYYVNGQMSYRYVNPDHPQEMFSPFYGDAAYNLWNAVVTSVP
jgi:V8-like Glu-specific endopeptidase